MAVSEEFCGGTPVAKSGAGGRGRRGLPPYWEDGVPGRGLPLISAGSYGTVGGGGRDQSEEPRVGVSGLMDEARSGRFSEDWQSGEGWLAYDQGLNLVSNRASSRV